MSESKKRKVHTAEFKAKVGLEAVRGMKTISEIAQAYGVHRKREIHPHLDSPSPAGPLTNFS